MASWFQNYFWEYPGEATAVHVFKTLKALQGEYSWKE